MSAAPGAVARFLAAPAAAAALACTAAGAQEVPQVISPLRVETDHVGVNLLTGRTVIELPVLSVPGAPNLRFDRVQNAAPYFKGQVQTAAPEGGVSTASYSVHTGQGSSESFRCVDFDCESVTGTGSTFIANTFRQAGTGAEWRFTKRHVDTAGPPRTQLYYASTATWPNGEVITYRYQEASLPGDSRIFYRPTRIESNLGFHITIAYAGDTLGTAEWNHVREAAIFNSAAPATPLGRLTYTDGGSTIRDLGGRTFTCSGCANMLGVPAETGAGSLTLPGETSPAYQAVASTQEGTVPGVAIVGSVIRDGVAWTYSYAGLRHTAATGYLYDRLTVTGPDGFRQAYDMIVSDNRHVITRITDSLNRPTAYEFDPSYRPTRMVLPEGNEVRLVYDGYGNVHSRTSRAKPGTRLGDAEPGTGLADIVETAFVDTDNCLAVACFRPVWSRDGMGRQTDYAYNANGQLTRQTDPADGVRRRTSVDYAPSPAGVSRRAAVELCGTGAACNSSAEIRTEFDYWGGTLLPSAERRISGATTLTTTYSYDPAGRPLAVDGPLAGTADATYYRYDPHGRRIREVGPLGANGLRIVQVHHYRDADDRLLATETGKLAGPDDAPTTLRRVEYGYDSRRNRVRETVTHAGADGTVYHGVVQRSFDDQGRLQCEARRMNPHQLAAGQLPASACDRDSTGSFGHDRITRNVYDAAGQLIRVQRGYDTPLVQTYAAYSYTPNGQRASVTDANGNRAELRYDGFDRLSRWLFPSPAGGGQVNAADYEEYRYDAAGNRVWLRKRDGSVLTYQHDRLDRLIVKTVPERTGLPAIHSRDVFYDYNVRDQMTDARFDSRSGEGVSHGYDGFGRMVSSSLDMDGATRRFTYTWDAAGNRIGVHYPGGDDFSYAFDAAGRLTGIADADAGEPLFSFTYSSLGLPDIRTDHGAGGVDHGYDRVDRLTSLAHTFVGGTGNVSYAFTYNPASQIATRTRSNDAYASSSAYDVARPYSVNGLNQYTAAGTRTFGYDVNGNLTRSGPSTYSYDVENRLVGASGGRVLRYDPLGRLYEATGPSGTRRFVWDGDALAAEYTVTGSLAATYVHGSGSGDDPLLWRGGGENRRLRADHQGSIVAITDHAGAAQWINGYDAWGIPNSTNGGRFQYTGQIWLGDFGLYHYKGRIYSPTLGRFLQVDPVGYEGGLNLYGYVENDPVNQTDSTGQFPDVILDVGLIVADVVDMSRNGVNRENAISLGANIVGAILPGATGLGLASRGGVRAERAVPRAERVSTLRPGPNARESVPATSSRATAAERRDVNRIGNEQGCHTCGASESGRPSGNWTPDHQPATSRNSTGGPQRLYPHCRNCSNRQGGEAARANMRDRSPAPPSPRRRDEIER